MFEHFPGFVLSQIYNSQNIKTKEQARNKRTAKKLYISLLYLNPDKHTTVVWKQMIFVELICE